MNSSQHHFSINNINIDELEHIISMDTFITLNNDLQNHYTNYISFKNINGIIKHYAILNYLNFEKFIDIIYNKIKCDYDFENIQSFEIIPLSNKRECGLELKDYLINNGDDLTQITSKEILHNNKYYYVITNNEKRKLILKELSEIGECPVCYIHKKLYIYYNCFHTMCDLCHLKWKRQLGTTCPTCRSC